MSSPSKKTAHITLLCFTLFQTFNTPAWADAFQAGKDAGAAANNSIYSGVKSGANQSKVPTFGNTSPTNLGSNYPGSGKDGPGSITNLMQKGTAVKNQACSPGDKSCEARSFVANKYHGASSNPYMASAKTMRAKAAGLNPEDVLGMNNLPTQGGSQVCTEKTTELPATTVQTECMDATMQQITTFAKYPTTTGTNYTSPVCLDPSYTISSDKSTCSKTVYSCPQGGTLNGTTCTQTTGKVTVYSGAVDCSKVPNLGYARNSQDHVQVNLSCSGNNFAVYADAWGSKGSGFGPGGLTGYLPIGASADNYPLVPLIPHWGGAFRQVGIFASGNCVNGICSYTFKAGWANNAWSDRWFEDCSNYMWDDECKKSYGFAFNTNPVSGGTFPVWEWGTKTPVDVGQGRCTKWDWGGNCIQHYKPPMPYVTFPPMTNAGTFWSQTVNFADPRQPSLVCPSGYADSSGTCTRTYPATSSTATTTPGCLGGAVYSAGQKVQDAPVYTSGTQSGGSFTCAATTYSCPAGMAMNGGLCEDSNRAQYEADPNCINLGYKPANGTEGYLCVTKQLDECSALPSTCTLKSSTCVWTDQVPGSPTYGQCIATDKIYDCPAPGATVTTQSCSYQPMCFNGNCFDQQKTCDPIPGVNPTSTSVEECQNLTKEDINSCGVDYIYGPPDENGEKHIIGAQPVANCQWLTQSNCTLAPIKQTTDNNGVSTWPDKAYFSCLGDTMSLCDKLDNDPECTLMSTSNEQYSIDGGTPVVISKKFSCTRSLNVATDTCTDDFGKMAASMETAREAGTYLDPNTMKMFGGEYHRCDRRSVTWGGSNLGSKSCCNISAPDPQSNDDIMQQMKMSVGISAAKQILTYAIDTGSSYVYDWMMQSETFQKIAGEISAASQATSAATAAEAGADAANATNAASSGFGVSYAGVGISYGGAAGTSAFGTSTFPIGGSGFNFTFNPYMFAIVVALQLFNSYQAALACDEEDYKTATLSKGKLCYSTGSWCAKKESGLFGSACRTFRTDKCCFNSKLARIINQQGRPQLGLDMHDCTGFTTDQLQQLDWSKIDLTEFVADMLTQAQKNMPTADTLTQLSDKIKGDIGVAGSTGVQPIDQGVNGKPRPHN